MLYRKICRLIILIMIAYLGCAKLNYKGDGTFVDNGFFQTNNRYELLLGRIDNSVGKKYKYLIGELPIPDNLKTYNIGLMIYANKINSVSSVVDLKLFDNVTGSLILNETSSLLDWSSTYYSIDGIPPKEQVLKYYVFLSGSSFSSIDNPNKTRGTYFEPIPFHTYTLTLEIIKEDVNAKNIEMDLMVRSGIYTKFVP